MAAPADENSEKNSAPKGPLEEHFLRPQNAGELADADLSVRVENPVALATFALNGDPEWSRADIDRAMHSGGRKRVDLPASIPVYMLYWTAFVEDDTINFRADLYDQDDKLDDALKAKSAVSL